MQNRPYSRRPAEQIAAQHSHRPGESTSMLLLAWNMAIMLHRDRCPKLTYSKESLNGVQL